MQALAADPQQGHGTSTVRTTLVQAVSVLVGIAGGLAVLVFGGLLAAFTGCVDGSPETTAFCPEYEDVATALEVLAVVVGALAPIAGGIASCVTLRARWVLSGLAVGALMVGAILLLSTGQQGLLS